MPKSLPDNFVSQNKRLELEFFDGFADHSGYEPMDERSYRKVLSYFKKFVSPKDGEVILDLGCGTGAYTERLQAEYPGNKIMGIDLSAKCIKTAAKNIPKVTFKSGDAENTGLPSESVDVVCYFGVLHHFPDMRLVAKEAFRILKPGGRFFSYDPHLYNPAFWLYRCQKSPLYSSVGVTANERPISGGEVNKFFGTVGFEVHTKAIAGITFHQSESKLAQILLPLYNLFDRMLELTPLAGLIGSYVIGWGVKPKN